MSSRVASWLAWSLWGVYLALLLTILILVGFGEIPMNESVTAPAAFAVAAVGALVAARRPRNGVGWILLTIVLLGATTGLMEDYVNSRSDPASVVGVELMAWFSGWQQYVWIGLVGIFVPLLFPHGRLPSRRWRPFAWVAAAAIVLASAQEAFRPGPLNSDFSDAPNPFGVGGLAGEAIESANGPVGVLFVLCFVPAAASLVLRWRRAHGEERQQLKWFAYLVGLTVSAVVVASASERLARASSLERVADAASAAGWLTFLFAIVVGMPVAIAVSIFKYRLYDIDVVIRRTLVYGTLTAILALAYVGGVLLLQQVFGPLTQGSDLAIAGSTLAVAALFHPARRWIQAAVDRRFYRRRYDAARTLDAFSARLREEVDLDALSAELNALVRETMQPAHVSLWLREARR